MIIVRKYNNKKGVILLNPISSELSTKDNDWIKITGEAKNALTIEEFKKEKKDK